MTVMKSSIVQPPPAVMFEITSCAQAEAAAQARFGKSAKDLTSYEAALLASVLPNPHKWRVDPPGPYVRSRSHTIRSRMDQVRRDGLDSCVLNAR